MAVSNEQTTISVVVNSEQAAQRIRELTQSTRELKERIDGMAKDNPERKQLQQQLKEWNSEIRGLKKEFNERITLVINGQAADATINELSQAQRKLWAELRKLPETAQEFIDKSAQYRTVTARLNELNTAVKGTEGFFSRLKNELAGVAGLAVGYLGLQALSQQVTNLVNKNAQLSDSLAGIRQTTQFTEEEVNNLNKALGKIDTRTATADLRQIATVAGQFGVAKNEILGFTEAINEATVVLKSEFKGGAEEITTTLAGLRNVLSDIKTGNIASDITHLGNSLIVLAQQGVATAPVVSDFANRIGGIGRPLGLTSGQILGLSASLQELNISTERGGTAVGRILQKMTQETAQFAKVAGVPVKEFERLINTNIYEAFLKFAAGSRLGGESATAFSAILKDSELSGAGASEVLAKLGANIALVSDKVKIASSALESTDAITEQYSIKNNNAAGALDRLGKKLYEVFTNKTFTSWIVSAVNGTSNFIDTLKSLPQLISDNAIKLIALGGAFALYNVRAIAATGSTIAHTAAKQASNVVDALHFYWLEATAKAKTAYALITDLVTGKVKIATAAQIAWNAALSLFGGLTGGIVVALTAIAAGMVAYYRNTDEALRLEKIRYEYQMLLMSANSAMAKSQDEINRSLERYAELAGNEKNYLENQIDKQIRLTKATYEQALADKEQIVSAESKLSAWQQFTITMGNFFDTHSAAEAKYRQEQANMVESENTHTQELEKLKQAYENAVAAQKAFEDITTAEARAMAMTTETTAQYEEKIRLLNVALKNAKLDSLEYKRITEEIAATQNQLKSKTVTLNVGGGISDADRQKIITKWKELNDQIAELKIRSILDEEQRELALLEHKHQRELDADGKTAQLRQSITEKYLIQKQQIEDKYFKTRTEKEYTDSLKNITQLHDDRHKKLTESLEKNEITLDEYRKQDELSEKQYYDELIQLAADYGKDVEDVREKAIAEGNKRRRQLLLNEANDRVEIAKLNVILATRGSDDELKARKDFLKAQAEVEFNAAKGNATRRKQIEAELNRDLEQIDREYLQQKLQLMSNAVDATAKMIAGINQIQDNEDQKLLAKEKRTHDKQKKNYDKLLADKVISREEYDAAIEKLDLKYHEKQEELRREAFERKKNAAIAEAIIKTALAVISALAEYDYAGAAIAAATGAVEIGVIESTEYEEYEDGRKPKKYKGGKQAVNKIIHGPSHEDGGIDLVDTTTGKIVGNMEGNEGIFSEKAYQNNPEIIDAIFAAGGEKINYVIAGNQPQAPESELPNIGRADDPDNQVQHQRGLVNKGVSVFQRGLVNFDMAEYQRGLVNRNDNQHYQRGLVNFDAAFYQRGLVNRAGNIIYQRGLLNKADTAGNIVASLVSGNELQIIKNLSGNILNSNTGASLTLALTEYQQFSNELLKAHRDRIRTMQSLDDMLAENNLQRMQSQLEMQQRLNQVSLLQNSLQQVGTALANKADDQVIAMQYKIYEKQSAILISDFDDRVISRQQFDLGTKILNQKIKERSFTPGYNLDVGEKMPYVDPYAPTFPEKSTASGKLPLVSIGTIKVPIEPVWVHNQEAPQLNTQKIVEMTKTERTLEVINVLKASGVIPVTPPQAELRQSAENNFENKIPVEQLDKTVRALNSTLASIQQNGIQAYLDYVQHKRDLELVAEINDKTTFG